MTRPMMSLPQLSKLQSNCLTLEGSFSSVWTATIAGVGVFCSFFFKMYTIKLLNPRNFADLRTNFQSSINNFSMFQIFAQFRYFSAQIHRFSASFSPELCAGKKIKLPLGTRGRYVVIFLFTGFSGIACRLRAQKKKRTSSFFLLNFIGR